MKLTRVLTLIAALSVWPISQASAVIIDFSKGMPANSSRISADLIRVGDYEFTGAGVGVGQIGHLGGINFGQGLVAPRPGNTLSIARTDGHSFDLNGLNVFIGGILVGGVADFEITPFDASGNELDPYVFRAGQFGTTYVRNGQALTGDNYAAYIGSVFGPFQNVSMLRLGSGVDHYTAFNLASAFDSPASVPLPGAVWLFLGGLLSLLNSRRTATAKPYTN